MDKGGKKIGFAKDRKRAKELGIKGGKRSAKDGVVKGFAATPELSRIAQSKSVEARRKNREAKLKRLQDEL